MNAAYFLATPHPELVARGFEPGDVVIDPWRLVHEREGVELHALGRNRPETISLLCPSRGRPAGLARMVGSALRTATRPRQVEIVAYVDEDDPADYDLLWEPQVRLLLGPRILLSDCWNRAADQATGEILGHLGDDVEFLTDGWDETVRAAFARVPDRILFAHGDDLGPNGQVFGTHGFLHRRWVEAVGYFVPPLFSSDWNDAWLNDVANQIGRRELLPISMEHHHPYFGKGEYDLTHQEREARGERDGVVSIYNRSGRDRDRDAAKLREAMR